VSSLTWCCEGLQPKASIIVRCLVTDLDIFVCWQLPLPPYHQARPRSPFTLGPVYLKEFLVELYSQSSFRKKNGLRPKRGRSITSRFVVVVTDGQAVPPLVCGASLWQTVIVTSAKLLWRELLCLADPVFLLSTFFLFFRKQAALFSSELLWTYRKLI